MATEVETQWAQIRALVEKALQTGLDSECWQDIRDAVGKYEARESGPLYKAFEERFLREGIDPEKASEMARLASAPGQY